MKKNVLYALFLGVVLAFSWPGSAVFAEILSTGATRVPDHLTLTWQEDPLTTQTITWRTDESVPSGKVQYREAKAKGPGRFIPAIAPKEFQTDLGKVHLFTTTLKGLKPGTLYAYRVGDGMTWSPWRTFHTESPKAKSFKFLVFGDSQSGISNDPDYRPWQKTVQKAFAAHRDAKFVINVGDLVENGQSYAHWNNWFEAAKGVIDTIPEMAVQGNHETYLPNFYESVKPTFCTVQFPLPQNGPEGLKNQVYSFDYGPVHFVVLDSQEEEEAPSMGISWKTKNNGWRTIFPKLKRPGKLFYSIKPLIISRRPGPMKCSRPLLSPIFDRYHVDVVFNGHDHGVARTFIMNHDEFVTRPSQGTVYYVTGRSGNKAYPDLSAKVWNAFFFDPQDQPNYLVVHVNAQKLTIKAVKQDGSVIDNYTIDKVNDAESPKTVAPSTSWTRYAKPVMVVYGNQVSPTMVKHEPMQKDNGWYVDLKAFVTYIGGSVSAKEEGAVIQCNGKTVPVAGDHLLVDKKVTMVKAETLKDLGFSFRYSKNTNSLFITR